MAHIVILGNGIAGITAARTIRKHSDHRITVVSGESDHFFSRTALMYVFMGHMRFEDTKPYEDWFWEKNRIELVKAWVETVDVAARALVFQDGRSLPFDLLLLATGSVSKSAGWPGEHLDGVQGFYTLQDLEALAFFSKGVDRAVVVGGGLIGVEMAEMLLSRNIPVTYLVREKQFYDQVLPAEEAALVTRHIARHGVDLRMETELKEIWGDKRSGRAKMAVTSTGDKIPCGFVGLTIGVRPNIDFLHFNKIDLDQGILVDSYLESNVPGIFAAGDCAQLRTSVPGRKPTEPLWYTARRMGAVAANNLLQAADKTGPREKIPYDPGIWFNSAKFFDLEYQVYGDIPVSDTAHSRSLFWQHPTKPLSIRICWNPSTGAVTGFNLMGIRYRQEVCEHWIRNATPLTSVLENLKLANFDPEFSRQYEPMLWQRYQEMTGETIRPVGRRRLSQVLRLLKPATRQTPPNSNQA